MICCDKCKGECNDESPSAWVSMKIGIVDLQLNSNVDEIWMNHSDLCEGCQHELKETLISTLKKFLGE